MNRIIIIAAVAVALAGCTYNATVGVTPALSVYSSHEGKINGRWALAIDVDRLADPGDVAGVGCSAHNYPIDMKSAFRASAVATIENLVEDVQLIDRPLPVATLADNGYAGQVILKSEELEAELQAIPGFWSGQIEGEVELTVSVIVDGRDGRLLGTSVQEDGEVRIGGGCGDGGEALGKAGEESLKRTLTVIGERLSNSRRIREYAAGELRSRT